MVAAGNEAALRPLRFTALLALLLGASCLNSSECGEGFGQPCCLGVCANGLVCIAGVCELCVSDQSGAHCTVGCAGAGNCGAPNSCCGTFIFADAGLQQIPFSASDGGSSFARACTAAPAEDQANLCL